MRLHPASCPVPVPGLLLGLRPTTTKDGVKPLLAFCLRRAGPLLRFGYNVPKEEETGSQRGAQTICN